MLPFLKKKKKVDTQNKFVQNIKIGKKEDAQNVYFSLL